MELKSKVGETNGKIEKQIMCVCLMVMAALQNKAGYMDWVWKVLFGGGCSGKV